MCESLLDIHWRDITEAFPAFFTILLMPLTYSIALGVGAGFILYTLIKVCSGKYREVHPFLYLMTILFAIQIIFCNS
jgi:AGZA family xanthine/uracil permease-like MFS transporter